MDFDVREILIGSRLFPGIIGAYQALIFARIILSWFPISPPDAIRPAFNFLYDLTEPFLRLFRRLLPPMAMGGMALDLSPLIAFFVLLIVRAALASVLQ